MRPRGDCTAECGAGRSAWLAIRGLGFVSRVRFVEKREMWVFVAVRNLVKRVFAAS
jgi:hypothetical protein